MARKEGFPAATGVVSSAFTIPVTKPLTVASGTVLSSTGTSLELAVSKLTWPPESTESVIWPTWSPKRPACWTSTFLPVRGLTTTWAGTSVCEWPLTTTSMPETLLAISKSSPVPSAFAPLWLRATTRSTLSS